MNDGRIFTHALIDTICWKKAYQLGSISGESSVIKHIFSKIRQKMAKRINLIGAYQLGHENCTTLKNAGGWEAVRNYKTYFAFNELYPICVIPQKKFIWIGAV